MKLEVSQVIDRPPEVVFRFVAVDHVRNHPRWDPLMELRQLTEGPMDVGTIIHRRHTHSGEPVEGTMEVVEFEPDRAMRVVIRDGPVEMRSRMTIQPEARNRSTLTINLDIPGMDQPIDPQPIRASLRKIKELIETEE